MDTFGGRITWLGHAAFLIESPGGKRIALDPWIGNNPKFPKGFDYGRLDLITASHGHFDHFGDDGIGLAKSTGAMVVGIFELSLHCQAAGVSQISGMNKGGTQTLAGIQIRMTHAVHSSGTSGAGKETNFPGDPCGYVLTFEDGFRIYDAGDTAVFSDMALIGELEAPDLALLPIGGFYTMDPPQAAKACELLRVPRVLPMHFGTFPALAGTPGELRAEIRKRGLPTEVVELAPGESWPLRPSV
ncbi:MAG TPA: metal-dependent hydrolase [Thermoanaerobaculia bacterium]|nr:metal-dependent hydrolase [Thermoanaerobaculia bacterium]